MKLIQFFISSIRKLLKFLESFLIYKIIKKKYCISKANRNGRKIQRFLEGFFDAKDYNLLEDNIYRNLDHWEYLSIDYGTKKLECRMTGRGLCVTTLDDNRWVFPDIIDDCILPHLSICRELIKDRDIHKFEILGPFDSFSEAAKYLAAYSLLVEIFRYEIYNKSILIGEM